MSTSNTSSGNPSLDAGRPETSGEGQSATEHDADLVTAKVAFRRFRGAVRHATAVIGLFRLLSRQTLLQALGDDDDALETEMYGTLIECAGHFLTSSACSGDLQVSSKFDADLDNSGVQREVWRIGEIFNVASIAMLGAAGRDEAAEDVAAVLELAEPMLERVASHLDGIMVPSGDEVLWRVGVI